MSTIKPGYQLTIRSWENDADHYQTKVLAGLTKEDTTFLIEVASLFKSRKGAKGRPRIAVTLEDAGGLGNGVVDMEYFGDLIIEMRARHPSLSAAMQENLDDILEEEYRTDRLYEWLCDDLIGDPIDYDFGDFPHFCRVADRYTVNYVPEAIQDVTSEFGSGDLR